MLRFRLIRSRQVRPQGKPRKPSKPSAIPLARLRSCAHYYVNIGKTPFQAGSDLECYVHVSMHTSYLGRSLSGARHWYVITRQAPKAAGRWRADSIILILMFFFFLIPLIGLRRWKPYYEPHLPGFSTQDPPPYPAPIPTRVH